MSKSKKFACCAEPVDEMASLLARWPGAELACEVASHTTSM